MRMLIVTNRRINGVRRTDETLFGEDVNISGASNIRFAWAEKVDDQWQLELVPEPRIMTEDRRPSREVFRQFRQLLIDNQKDCVFYIHGYNQSFEDTLEQGHEIQERYDVVVVVFSWPSNPGGFIPLEYNRARAIARESVIALDRTFELMGRYLRENLETECDCSFNLLAHSLGCYLFENFIRDPVFSGETRLFSNIVLNAADVDSDVHPEWVNKLRFSRRVYATINEDDYVLDASDIINPDRLGNTAENLTASRAIYLDFTDGDDVRKKHQHFGTTAEANDVVLDFFQRVLHGREGVPGQGFEFNADKNAYELDD